MLHIKIRNKELLKFSDIQYLKMFKGENVAIINQYNGKIRVYKGENDESFYRDLHNAIKDLLNDGYIF